MTNITSIYLIQLRVNQPTIVYHLYAVLSQSGEISPDFFRFYGGGIRHDEDIMHSFQNFIVRLIPNHPPPLETRIWKLVVRALLVRDPALVRAAQLDILKLQNHPTGNIQSRVQQIVHASVA